MINIKVNSPESRALAWLRFPLALLVVLIHTAYTQDQNDFGFYLGNLISNNLANIAVPTFFFISGYLFFCKYDKFEYKDYLAMIKKKSKTLLLPYFIWNLITYIYIAGWHLFADGTFGDIQPWELYKIFWAVDDGYVIKSIFGYQFSILCSPICGVLWFVRDLIVAMIVSPLIWWIVRRIRMWSVIIFLLPWLLHIGIPIKGFGLMALCFFPMGGTFSICGKDIFIYVKKYGKYVLAAFLCFLLCNSFITFPNNIHRVLNNLMILTGIFGIFHIALQRVIKSRDSVIIRLGETSFFIYVFHTCFIFNPLHYIIDPISTIPFVGCTLAYISSFVIRVGLSVAVYYTMKRLCPKILAILVGNRVSINR